MGRKKYSDSESEYNGSDYDEKPKQRRLKRSRQVKPSKFTPLRYNVGNEPEQTKPKAIITINNTTGEWIFGNINNIVDAHDKPGVINAVPIPGGTVMMNRIITKFPTTPGSWSVYRAHSQFDPEATSVWFAAQSTLDPAETLKFLFTIAPPDVTAHNDAMLSQHVFVINRYDWETPNQDADMDEQLDKVDGPASFLIQPNHYEEVYQWVTKAKTIDRPGSFEDHGLLFVLPGEEEQHARILLNVDNTRMAAFAFFSSNSDFRNLCVDGILIDYSFGVIEEPVPEPEPVPEEAKTEQPAEQPQAEQQEQAAAPVEEAPKSEPAPVQA